MAAFDTTRPTTLGIGSGTRLNGVINSLPSVRGPLGIIHTQLRNALYLLSDRELDDIGAVARRHRPYYTNVPPDMNSRGFPRAA